MPKLSSQAQKPLTHSDGTPIKQGELRYWICPRCKRKHTGFKQDICRNEKCRSYGRIQG